MAKKKAPAKKKKASTSESSGGFVKGVVVTLLVIAVIGIVLYALNETNQYVNKSETETKKATHSAKGNSSASTAKKQSERSNSNSKKKEEKFQAKDINAKDKLVESNTTNENIPDYTESNAYYFTSSFDFGWPAYKNSDAIVEHQYYTFSYNEKTEQPYWVAYTLTKKQLDNARFKRKDDFRSDPDVSSESASVADYKKSGYDRGHLAPAAAFTWDKEALSETFYMSNMSPQEPGFNRGIWKKLESKVRAWAKANHKVYVVTGPITKGISKKIGANKVAVPSHYYKAILDITEPSIKAIGFVMKNKKSSADLMEFAVSIDDLEKQTGLDFFPNIPDDLEKQIESTLDLSLWK